MLSVVFLQVTFKYFCFKKWIVWNLCWIFKLFHFKVWVFQNNFANIYHLLSIRIHAIWLFSVILRMALQFYWSLSWVCFLFFIKFLTREPSHSKKKINKNQTQKSYSSNLTMTVANTNSSGNSHDVNNLCKYLSDFCHFFYLINEK